MECQVFIKMAATRRQSRIKSGDNIVVQENLMHELHAFSKIGL